MLHSPAECRVLNYKDDLSASALRQLQDRSNHAVLGESSIVPAGLSQTSYFDEDGHSGLADFITNTDEFDQDDKYHSSALLKNAFYDAAEAINNSDSKEKLERELMKVLNKFSTVARGDCEANKKKGGRRMSMFPANSKRKKTHGTKHMH